MSERMYQLRSGRHKTYRQTKKNLDRGCTKGLPDLTIKQEWCYGLSYHTPHTSQPLYGPFSGTTRVSRCQKRTSTLWCKGRLTQADTPIIRLGATPSGLTSAHLHHSPFFTGRMTFLLPNQQCQSTEGNYRIRIWEKTLEFSSTVLPALSLYHMVNGWN